MIHLMLLLPVFVLLFMWEGLPVARAGRWRDFAIFVGLWTAALILTGSLLLDLPLPNPTEWMVAAARLLSPVRDLLLPGIDLF